MNLHFTTTDVFTRTRFEGNPLAIVEGADVLTDAQMQTIAREFNLSETIFVQTPDDLENSAKVRIFFPTSEIPFAGHPTVGCAIHLACAAHDGGDFDALVTLEEVAGLVPVEVTRRGREVRAEFTAPVLPHAPTTGSVPSAEALMKATGLPVWAIGCADHAPAVWEGGPRFLFVPVATLADLAAAKPHEPGWSGIVRMAGTGGVYLYTRDGAGWRGRMFAPTDGIMEDPATGSASAIFAAQLLQHGELHDGDTRITLRQGVEMGRASEIELTVVVRSGAIEAVRIAGSAVPVSQGTITV